MWGTTEEYHNREQPESADDLHERQRVALHQFHHDASLRTSYGLSRTVRYNDAIKSVHRRCKSLHGSLKRACTNSKRGQAEASYRSVCHERAKLGCAGALERQATYHWLGLAYRASGVA